MLQNLQFMNSYIMQMSSWFLSGLQTITTCCRQCSLFFKHASSQRLCPSVGQPVSLSVCLFVHPSVAFSLCLKSSRTSLSLLSACDNKLSQRKCKRRICESNFDLVCLVCDVTLQHNYIISRLPTSSFTRRHFIVFH